ncbi:MAG: choice-of-anchor E domain-containing protein [Planctomycetes bacterium]|nr:choice-of-anchor E domain-containing protein [Planctomycetota bacterium]
MFSRRTLAHLLSPCAALVISVGAQAQIPSCPPGTFQGTNTVTDSFGPVTPTWPPPGQPQSNFVMRVPKFNPAPGQTLIAAEVTASGSVSGSVQAENQSNLSPCNLAWTLGSVFEIDTPIPGQPAISVPESIDGNDPLAVFDGALDYDGPSGEQHLNLNGASSNSILITDPAVLASVFTGTGDLEFPHRAVDTSGHLGCGNLSVIFENTSQVGISVRYIYCSTTPPNECEEVNRRQCGSLLLFPEYDNRAGDLTLVSVTNSCCDDPNGGTWIEVRFIEKDFCTETNRSYFLTACDTLSFLTSDVNPNGRQGYLYVYAKAEQFFPGDPNNTSGRPWVFNHLIGQELIINGIEHVDYSMNAVSFLGYGEERSLNDDDNDGIRDLNGPNNATPEYAGAPEEILIPRFLGQDLPGQRRLDVYKSQVVLIALSGGAQFRTIVDVLGYNDNEDPLSHQYEFGCWDKPYLRDLAPWSVESFLESMNTDDPDEILGASYRNAGWLRLDGLLANSSGPEAIDNPAIYAVLIERTGPYMAADLPFERCTQYNGDLLPLGILGDGPNPVAGDDQ